jgi:phosphoglycolate phosphatase-like HAD superfamily hydrolase
MAGYDCALFDVDGVLVDIRRSYNEAIKETVGFVLKKAGIKHRNLVTDRLILKFRESGGFNNDTDTSYAIVLAAMANPGRTAAQARKFLFTVAENADSTGVDSLEPKYCVKNRPFIANDRLVVSKRTMKLLNQRFAGKLAIVSGRSRLAAEYSLAPVMKYFDIGACVFLEDEKREYAKPSPYAIKKAMTVMDATTAVYAGDSAEDLMMARRAEREAGYKIVFVGIYGYSPMPADTLRQFKEQGADATAKSVNSLPILLNRFIE